MIKEKDGYDECHLNRLHDDLHFARKHEQRVWGKGCEHEDAHAEVKRLEAILNFLTLTLPTE